MNARELDVMQLKYNANAIRRVLEYDKNTVKTEVKYGDAKTLED